MNTITVNETKEDCIAKVIDAISHYLEMAASDEHQEVNVYFDHLGRVDTYTVDRQKNQQSDL